jgi:nitrite reductase/ring-hydroxylating ferredoxin subunit
MATFVKAADRSEIPDGGSKRVEIDGKLIALFNCGGTFYAVDDECTHRGGYLSGGFVEDNEVECPLHGARFDLKTGEAVGPPAEQALGTYTVRVTGEVVEVAV